MSMGVMSIQIDKNVGLDSEEMTELFNLIRLSDSFFPIGSYTMSQGMEQLVNDEVVQQSNLYSMIETYKEKIWNSFDIQIYYQSIDAILENNLNKLIELDRLCHVSKIAEESRIGSTKMGHNMLRVIDFAEPLLIKYKQMVHENEAFGTYPVVLAAVTSDLNISNYGAVSLIYVNSMELTASLVRLGVINFIEAQEYMKEQSKKVHVSASNISDLHQSSILSDIAQMRHEVSNNRMFIT